MTLSLPTAVALLALAVAFFAVLAVAAVYARLRQVERAVGTSALGPPAEPAPLRTGPGRAGSLVLFFDGQCPVCGDLWRALRAAVRAGELAHLRPVVVAASGTADRYRGDALIDVCTDPDVWAALYEGYTPTVTLLDAAGTVVDRRFVYADTDHRAVLAELAARLRLRETA